jgi:hypothetical protein
VTAVPETAREADQLEFVIDPAVQPADVAELDRAMAALLLDLVERDERERAEQVKPKVAS